MARKVLTVTIMAEGRDTGRAYLITEMPASQAERWGARAMNSMAKALGGFPESLLESGLAGLTAVALSAFARSHFDDIEPLLDEMFTCIKFIPNPQNPNVVRPLIEDDIEEVSTRLKLREEVLGLHLNFFKPAVILILTAMRTRFQPFYETDNTSNASTSQEPSPLSSPAD